jgi:serine phosphatase RsbU (regulator of sigma subunit)
LAIGGALPLGIYEGAEPSLLRFTLNPSDRLLLLSDGIVEARNSKGELYGFERVQQLLESRPSAAEVAAAAQRFGQDDDISVIAITRSPAPA